VTERDLLSAIIARQDEASRLLGEVHGTVTQLLRTCSERSGRCGARFEAIESAADEVEEVSQVLAGSDIRRRTIWWTLAKVAGAIVALVGLAAGAIGVLKSCSAIDALRTDVARSRHVRLVVQDHARDEALTWIMERQREVLQRLPRLDWLVLDTGDGVPRPKWRQ